MTVSVTTTELVLNGGLLSGKSADSSLVAAVEKKVVLLAAPVERQSPAQSGPRAPSLCRHVLIHNTLRQLQAALHLAPAPALPSEPLFLGEEDFFLLTTIGSILRELETSMDETEAPQNLVAPLDLQHDLLPQPDPVFLEALSSRCLGDSGLDDFFLDMDTSAVEKEPSLAPPDPPPNLFCA
ncbi:SERTA domain-containing protein 3 [Tupaia chinensis]|uniref:SERTA domain-containing protein 3 n=1 Tax=Tupaia chinensis TaxID=246437 RepID=L9KC32_TUPCH|nr:SERTA domain-containing protein 3 [Tupaia chinensis]